MEKNKARNLSKKTNSNRSNNNYEKRKVIDLELEKIANNIAVFHKIL